FRRRPPGDRVRTREAPRDASHLRGPARLEAQRSRVCRPRSLPPGGIFWHGGGRRREGFAMTVADVAVVIAAVAALAGLGWFFFAPRRARMAELAGGVQRITVTVRGGY